ncbi:lysozyme inhibitor LprI family protein [Vitreimonas flagellata]|uniref:lysozyme inhibitor LprI family protein n=1 Tax=Vitreimonas flagellata TaxID=2560861 RepID=UPI0010753B94|nr:lysozyme inhibitor LprI family protein [Vitreimonas flagellata]
MRFLLVLLAIGFASPAAAAPRQETTVATCVAAAGDDFGEGFAARRACIGQVSAACQNESDGGVTTAGMVMCADRERAQWEALGEAALAILRAQESATQTSARERALSAHATAARERCAYEASRYEGGSLAIFAAAACAMNQAADLALMLHARTLEG